MKKILLFLLMAMFAPWAMMAQETLTIYEDGTATNTNVPVFGTWADAFLKCEFVVPASELEEMNGGTISQMDFYLTSPAAAAWTGTFQVFLKEVDNATISSYYGSGDATIVYEGQLDATQSTMTVEFSDNYVYGGGNLLVGVYQIVKGNWKAATFAGASVTGASGQGYSSGSLDAITFSQKNFIPKTTFTYIPGGGGSVCERPETLETSDVTSTSALLTWTGGEGTYNVEYKKTSDEEWTSLLTNSTLTQFELSGLAPGTNYQARVQSTCGTDPETGDPVTSSWKSVNFATMFGIPLIEPFAATTIPYGWNRYSGLLSDVMSGTALTPISSYWNFGPGSNGVFDSHTYINNYSTGHYFWLVTPAVLMEDNVELSFDLALTRYSGTLQPVYPTLQSDDKFVVLITTDGGTTWEILRQWDNQGSEYVYNNIPCTATGEYVAIDLSSYAGQNIAVAFYAESTNPSEMSNTDGDNNLHIDNVSIDYIPTCSKPTGLAYSDVTGHTVNLTWTPGAEGQTQWQICLNGDEDNLILVNSAESAYTLTGLTGVTPYTAKVRAYCNETDQSPWSNQVSFTTQVTCDAPTSLTSSNVTNHSATLDWTSDATEWILAYRLYSGTDDDYVEVPVTEKPYILDGLTPETRYMVRVRANCGEEDGLSTWSTTTNFTLLEPYPAPSNLTCDSTFAYTAYFSWTERGSAEDWEVAYKLATDPDDAYIIETTPDNHPYMLGDFEPLLPGTDYVLKVRSIYFTDEEDITSAWSNEVAFTTLQTCPAPTGLAVVENSETAHGATLNWNSVYSDSWNVKYRTPTYVIGTEEQFNTTSAPQGWTRYSALLSDVLNGGSLGSAITSGSGWVFSNTNVFGEYHTKLNIYGTGVKYWLVTPELTLADGPALNFDLALTDYNNADPIEDATAQADDKFVVLIYANDAWTILREWNNSGSEYVYNTIATTGENVSIDLSAYQGQTVQIAFYGESTVTNNGDNDLHIDNVAIGTPVPATAWTEVAADAVPFELTGLNPETYYEVVVTGNCGDEISDESASVFFTTRPSCQAPTELVVANESVTAHAATLSWTENGSATEWVIEYTTDVDENAVAQTINVTENPYTLTGLLAETPYAVKVKAYCSTTDQSDWSNTVLFTTPVACPAPTELAVDEESITTNGATLTWNGTSESYILQMADLSAATISEEVVEAFSENFEGGSVPAGWTNEGAASWSVGTGDYSTSTGAHDGTYNAKINHGTTDNVTYFVSPVIDLSAYANAKLSCWYVNRSWSGDVDGFGVYYRLGNGEWNELFSTSTAHDSWTQLSQLSLPSESNVQLGFKFADSFGYGVGLDDILIEGNPFAYEWTIFDSEATSPYTVENLTSGTGYMVRVIGVCEGEGESLPSAAISLTTAATCVVPTDFAAIDVTAYTATLEWNGENDSYVVNYRVAAGTQDWINVDFENGLPDGWTNEGAASWSVGTGDYSETTGAHGGEYNAKINHGENDDETYLVTPNIDLSEQSDLSLNLWYINRSWAGDTDGFGIYYRIDGGAWNEIFATTDGHSSWTQLSLELPDDAYAANCQFGFKFTDGYGYGVGLDDINISMPTPAGEWMTATVNDTTVVLNSLLAETTYEAMVQAVCTEDDLSAFTEPMTFTTLVACPAVTELAVSDVDAHSAVLSWDETGEATTWQICVNGDEDNLIEVTETTYTVEGLTHNTDYTVKVRAYCGEEDGASAWRTVSFHTEIACYEATNLIVENIGTESATLMWEGTSDSYVVQYRPWRQIGEDAQATEVLTTYTYDLSEYEGRGSIAIRHYNISDLFSVNVDDIVVTNAQGETVFSENFEGSISSAISIMDLDGDGYNWGLGTSSTDAQGNPTGNGNYYLNSESYVNFVGALTPDNWLVISDVELGGQLTFVARALDPEWVGDNFGVFVSAEEGAGEETVEGDTQFDLWDLTPNTTYIWQVKGVCGEDESQWVSSFFTTMDDYLTFVTDGDWNDVNNWNPAELPTSDKNVHIEANAIIPAGVVAEANKITIDGGSITIEDGGQLKQNSATLKVTMEKTITGYGEGDGNYYLLSSPFSGRTLYQENDDWNHIEDMFPETDATYDLYAFDPTVALEWINYKSSDSHISFQSSSGNAGLMGGEGYLYANQEGTTIKFIGTTGKSNNYSKTIDVTYDAESTDAFNGWRLVGNFSTCNAYINYVDADGDLLEADLYVMNETGNGFVLAESNELAPLTGAFLKVNAAGKIQYSTEPIDASPALSSTNAPCLPLDGHNQTTDQDANCHVCGITLDENNEWFENFDGFAIESTERLTGTTMGDCWTWNRLVELPTDYVDTVPQIYNRSAFAHSGDYSLLLWHRGVYAMPELDEAINLNDLKMSFYLRQSYSFYTLLVGVMTNPNDPETFEPIAHIDNGSSTGVEYAELSFANYQGEGRYIAFKNVRPTATSFDGQWSDFHSVNYIDDITLTLMEEGDCILSLPFTQDFEDVTEVTTKLTGANPDCWGLVQADVANMPFDKQPQVYYQNAAANDGDYSLRMVNRGVYALPEMEMDYGINDVHLEMYVRQPNACYQLQVGVWDGQEFTPVALVNNTTTGYELVQISFSNYDGAGSRIAFRNVVGNGLNFDYSYNYIDDIYVYETYTDCEGITVNYSENFDSFAADVVAPATGVKPDCWEVVDNTIVEMAYNEYPQIYNNELFANSGSSSLRMTDRCVFAMPYFMEDENISSLHLSMYLRQPNEFYTLEVGVWDPQNAEFTPVATFDNPTSDVTFVECDFSSYEGPEYGRIAFRNTLKGSKTWNYSYNYIDDVTLDHGSTARNNASNENVIDAMGADQYLESIAVYPNPTVGELHIGAMDVQKVECYNQMGQLVAAYNNVRDIDINGLANGVYTLRITVPQGVTMRKVVKK